MILFLHRLVTSYSIEQLIYEFWKSAGHLTEDEVVRVHSAIYADRPLHPGVPTDSNELEQMLKKCCNFVMSGVDPSPIPSRRARFTERTASTVSVNEWGQGGGSGGGREVSGGYSKVGGMDSSAMVRIKLESPSLQQQQQLTQRQQQQEQEQEQYGHSVFQSTVEWLDGLAARAVTDPTIEARLVAAPYVVNSTFWRHRISE